MSNEITYSAGLTLNNGYLVESQRTNGNLFASQATPGSMGDTQIVGFAADEVIGYGDLVAPRWTFVRNVSTSNNITIGPTSGGVLVPFITLLPGEIGIFPLAASVVMRGQSTVTNNKLKKLILET